MKARFFPAILLLSSELNATAFTPRKSSYATTNNNSSATAGGDINIKGDDIRHQSISRQRRTTTSSVARKMGSQALVYGTAAATTFGMQTVGFLAAYLLKTETFYDIFGGTNYIVVAILSAILGAVGDGALNWVDDPRKILTTVLFACSRGWLLLFLAWRAHERKGDARFDEVLGKNGNPPQPLNFLVYWMAQAFWVMLVSMPMLFVNSSNLRMPSFSPYDIAWAVLFGSGVLIEIVADIQKAMWVKNGRPGDFCEVGLWKYSRKECY
jgi:steroid 5-alpha reductase family enzyme